MSITEARKADAKRLTPSLRPCPFCGNRVEMYWVTGDYYDWDNFTDHFAIGCQGCGMDATRYDEKHADAVAIWWNGRAEQ